MTNNELFKIQDCTVKLPKQSVIKIGKTEYIVNSIYSDNGKTLTKILTDIVCKQALSEMYSVKSASANN